MPSVDNRVVEMRFDNKDFETDVHESISSLDKLKKALNFKDAADGMDEIEKETDAMSVKFSALASFTDQWIRNFTNQVYQLKNQFVGLVKSLSTDQVAEGWTKYGTKTQAVQTIMAATASQIEDEGERMEYVNEQISRLNWFADETSASLMDMTNNIGKFTNNGVALQEAVTSMQGIANWGYLSGANINEMSRAMYNLSQALSVGAVTLIDWKSIENANMATVEFKQTALDTAVAVGTLTKVSDGLYKTLEGNEVTLTSFNQYLTKDRWFNKEVLAKTLNKYGDFTNELSAEMDKIEKHQGNASTSMFLGYLDEYLAGTLDINEAIKKTGLSSDELLADLKRLGSEEFALGRKAFKAAQEAKTFTEALEATKDAVSSKWMQTFEIIFGSYTDAKELWTNLSNELWDIFASGGDARNDMLRDWAKSEEGGYKKFWAAVWNIWDGLRGLGSKIKSVWKTIFPGLSTEKLIDFTKKFFEFSEKFKAKFADVDEAISNVAETIGGGLTKAKEKVHEFIENGKTGEVINKLEETAEKVDSVVLTLARTIRDIDTLEVGIWGGKYSNNPERKKMLEELGYNYEFLQNKVNETAGVSFRYTFSEGRLAEAERLVNEGLIEQYENLVKVQEGMSGTTEEVENARTWIDNLRDVLGGLKSAIDLVVEAAKLAYQYLVVPTWQFLVNAFKKVLSIIAPFSKAFSNFVTTIKETKAISNTFKMLGEYLRMIKENLKGHENFQKLSGYIEELKQKLADFKEGRVNKFTEFLDKVAHLDQHLKLPKVSTIADWVDGVLGYFNKLIEGVQGAVGFWPKIKEFLKNLDFSNVKNFGKSAGEGIAEFLKGIFKDDQLKQTGKNWVDGIWEGFVEKLKMVDWTKVFTTLFKAFNAAVLLRLGLAIGTFFNSFKNVGRGTVGLLESIGGVLGGFTKTLKATAFLEVAIGIGILAAAMFALSKVNQQNLADVAVDMAIVILAITALMSVLTRFGNIFAKNKMSGSISEFGKIQIYFPRLGVALIGIALTIGSIVLAVKALEKVKPNDLWRTFGFIAAIFGLFTGLAILLDKLKVSGRKMIAIAGAFAIVAIGLDLMIPAIGALAGLFAGAYLLENGKAIWSALGAIVAIMLAFGGMALMAKNTNNILGVAASFIIVAVAIGLMTPALMALTASVATNGWGNLIAVVIAIIAILAAFTGAFVILNYVGKKHGSIDKGVKAMLALAAGVVAIGAVLWLLKGTKWDDLKGSVKAIVIVLGALIAVIGILAAIASATGPFGIDFTAFFVAFAAGAALLGAAVALAGVGILAFAKALQILSDSSVDAKKSGKNLAEGLIAFFDELDEKGGSIIRVINKILMAVVGALIAYKSDIIGLGTGIVKGLGNNIIDALGEGRFKLAATVLLLIGTVLYILGLSMPDVANFLGYMIANIINSVAGAVYNTSSAIFKSIKNLIDALGYALTTGIEELLGGSEVFEKLDNELNDSWYHTLQDIDSFTGGIFNLAEKYKDSKHPIVAYGNFVLKENEKGKEAFLENLQETQNIINEGLEGSGQNLASSWNFWKSVGEQVEDGAEYLDTSLVSLQKAQNDLDLSKMTIDDYDAYLNELAKLENKTIKIEKRSQSSTGFGILSSIFGGMFDGKSVTDGAENASASLQNILGGAVNFDQLAQTYSEGGSNVMNGWYEGMLKATTAEEALAAYDAMTKDQTDAVTGYYSMNSPSKLMIKLGGYVVEGFAIGISNKSFMINRSLINMFDKMDVLIKAKLNELKNTFYVSFNNAFDATDAIDKSQSKLLSYIMMIVDRLNSAINGNIELNPVIRPVLDLSEIQNGQMRLGSMLGVTGYSFNPNLSYSIAGANTAVMASGDMSLKSNMIDDSLLEIRRDLAQVNTDNHTIINTLSRYLPYIPEFAHMQVTLDKKTLVGELTPAINSKLGDIALRKR